MSGGPRSWRLDLLLLLLLLGLAVPFVLGAVRQMRLVPVFWSRQGPVLAPPKVGELSLLRAAPRPLPTSPAAARQRAVAEAERRGYRVGEPRQGDLGGAAVALLEDGGAILLLDRKGSTCRIYDPRRGEGVIDLHALLREYSGTYRPLRVADQLEPPSPTPADQRPATSN